MTDKEIRELIKSMPNSSWKSHFNEDEWFVVVKGLYQEFRKYSNVDMGFGMYYQAGLMKLLSADGPNILRQRFLY